MNPFSFLNLRISTQFLTMDQLVCLKDFAEVANEKWTRDLIAYFNGGADDEITVQENRDAYNRWRLRPRFLRDVSQIATKVSVLGKPARMPIGFSPAAMQCLLHPDGELATVSAADKLGAIYILSFHSTKSLEEVAAHAPNCRKWFQIPLQKGRDFLSSLVQRAESAGFEAIVLSVDTAGLGKRRQLTRVPFVLPPLANVSQPVPEEVSEQNDEPYEFDLPDHAAATLDPSYTWEIIDFLKSQTKLPIVVKGVQTGEDAELAVMSGVSAILVSNHGGRQLDCVLPTIEILPEVVEAVGGRVEVYVDGGVMRGSDVFKALALGASMVFVGRGILWGLGVGGREGAEKVIQILYDEFHSTMTLCGVKNISEINKSYLKQFQNCSR